MVAGTMVQVSYDGRCTTPLPRQRRIREGLAACRPTCPDGAHLAGQAADAASPIALNGRGTRQHRCHTAKTGGAPRRASVTSSRLVFRKGRLGAGPPKSFGRASRRVRCLRGCEKPLDLFQPVSNLGPQWRRGFEIRLERDPKYLIQHSYLARSVQGRFRQPPALSSARAARLAMFR